MQTFSDAKFLEQLIALTKRFSRREYLLAEELGISVPYLSRLKAGPEEAKASNTLKILVDLRYKMAFTDLGDSPGEFSEVAASASVRKKIENLAAASGMTVSEFLVECANRKGNDVAVAIQEESRQASVLREIASSAPPSDVAKLVEKAGVDVSMKKNPKP